MRCLCFCSLGLLTLSARAAHTFGQQQPFLSTSPKLGGELYKFNLTQTKVDILGLAEGHGLDVWHVSPYQAHIFVPFDTQNSLNGLPDVLQAIPHDISSIPITRPLTHPTLIDEWDLSSLENTTYHSVYHPLHEVNWFVHQLAESFPDKVKVVQLGHSALGREMFAVKLSSGALEDDEDDEKKPKPPKPPKRDRPGKERELDPNKKLGFVIVGAQHAREWVAKSASTYLAHALAVDSTESWSLSHLLDAFDFYIIPSPNPDGYAYTWEEDRFWYKNRQVIGPREKCVGVDMNRNWGYKWEPYSVGEDYLQSNHSTPFSSEFREKKSKRPPADPCSFWYPGHRPFESPEVNNIANWAGTLPNLVGLIELRAYGQMLSTPFSYSCNHWPFDLEDQTEAGEGAVMSLKHVHGTVFEIDSLCSNLYPAPGNMIDWMYKRLGIKYTYVAHLRDTGTYGFALPAHFIRPVGEETGAMIEYLSKFIRIQMKRFL
ncbi:Zn-dependent exopeptidase [Marasmius fiardii PR-910]|nr:Zn-dependent exopeptidase [Marasmius fiardii PR-910]